MPYRQEIEPSELTPVLESLSQEMHLRNIKETHLIVIGGAAMNLGGYHLRATIDVDVLGVVKNPETTGKPELSTKFSEGFEECIRRVADEYNLMENWLNLGPSSITGTLPDGYLKRSERRDFGEKLSIHLVGRLDLIHLKLHALINTAGSARGEVHREDLEQLDPDPDELKAAIRWSHGLYQRIEDSWDWDNTRLRNGYRNIFKQIANESLDENFFDKTDEYS